MPNRLILTIEDDAALRATLVEQLAMEGDFTTDEAASLAEADAKLSGADARHDAILLDIGLPDGDGRDFCAKLRRAGKKMPVIMLTGADAESDVVRGLDAGANDYIAKPFRLPELLARVRAHHGRGPERRWKRKHEESRQPEAPRREVALLLDGAA